VVGLSLLKILACCLLLNDVYHCALSFKFAACIAALFMPLVRFCFEKTQQMVFCST
jgi:hypothetical protein